MRLSWLYLWDDTAQIRVKNWAAIIQERNESGLFVKDYCAQHQLS